MKLTADNLVPFTHQALEQIEIIYTHASCPDGTSAAMIAAAAFASIGKYPAIKTIQYGTEEHFQLLPTPNTLFIDITPHINNWKSWESYSPIILDHHITARDVTLGLNGIYGGTDDSGATLAYKYVMLQLCPFIAEEWKEFAYLSMVRDTWKKDLSEWPKAQALSQALIFYNINELIEKVRNGTIDFDPFYSLGYLLIKRALDKAELLAKGASLAYLVVDDHKYKIGFFNCTEKLISETGNHLIEAHDCDMAVGYFYLHEDNCDKVVVSLRSKAGGDIAVNVITEQFGGGGHAAAAGFSLKDSTTLSLKNLQDLIIGKLYNLLVENQRK
jgi:oligoribonuclease NrnB/cAMP/cGMP phosphodiesterase (DHH superfamily)